MAPRSAADPHLARGGDVRSLFLRDSNERLVEAGRPDQPAGCEPADNPPRGDCPGPGSWAEFRQGPATHFVTAHRHHRKNCSDLEEAWVVPTGDAVTATPDRRRRNGLCGFVGHQVLRCRSGYREVRWSFNSIHRRRDSLPRRETPRSTSDGGLITSSRVVRAGKRSTRPALVIFGGGSPSTPSTRDTGALVWKHAYRRLTPTVPTTDDQDLLLSCRRGRESSTSAHRPTGSPAHGDTRGRQPRDRRPGLDRPDRRGHVGQSATTVVATSGPRGA